MGNYCAEILLPNRSNMHIYESIDPTFSDNTTAPVKQIPQGQRMGPGQKKLMAAPPTSLRPNGANCTTCCGDSGENSGEDCVALIALRSELSRNVIESRARICNSVATSGAAPGQRRQVSSS